MAVTMENMAAQSFLIRCAGFGVIMGNSHRSADSPVCEERQDNLADRAVRAPMTIQRLILPVILVLALSARAQNLAGDMALSLILIDGEDWTVVAEGYQFTDAPCADVDGNFYFTDVAKGTD